MSAVGRVANPPAVPDISQRPAGRVLRALHASVLFGLALALHAPAFVVTDSDAYYHLRHAWVYRTQGLLDAAFPWTQGSVVGALSADLWYGFHILLVPLTWIGDLASAIRIGAVGVTFGALWLVYLSLRRLGAAMPLGWTVALTVASGDLAFRLTMLRPHALSLGATLWLFALLIGPPRREARHAAGEWLPICAVAGLLAWLHLALVWIPLLVLGVGTAATALFTRRPLPAARALALLGGLLAGWLARPNPVGAGRLAWIQVVEFQRAKARGAIQVGHELLPLDLPLFVSQLLPLALVFAIAAVVAFATQRARGSDPAARASRIPTWSAFVLAAGFLGLSFGSARRATEFFVGFALLFVAQVAMDLVRAAPPARHRGAVASSTSTKTVVTILLVVGLAFGALRSFPVVKQYQRLVAHHFSPERFRSTGAWLGEHAVGQVALNVHWDRFGQLFFWGPQTYYINGMDPIFEYAFDPRLHAIHHLLATDTMDAFTTEEGRLRAHIDKDLHRLVVEDFRASWIVTEGRRTPRLVQLLSSTPGFEKAFESGDEFVFRVK